jgi:uncharacterized protein (DUF427 family)
MSLTMGRAPFGPARAGRFNGDVPLEGVVYVEPTARRIRGLRGDEVVVDSSRARMVHEHARLARYAFPAGDVRLDLLADGDATVHREPPLDGLVEVRWDALDRWLEEDHPLIGHAIDPYHRVDALPTSRHVVVSLDGEVLAESRDLMVIFETGLPPRWYFRPEDVVAELRPSDLRTVCAYKGDARYWSVGGEENLAWTYDDPRHDASPVAGHVAFFDERVDVDVDGERQGRPDTPWVAPRWWART